jgi:multidrug resistance efflux pump
MRGGSEGRRQQTLMMLAEAGSTVGPGTVVAEFENRWLEDHIDDRRSMLTQSQSAVEKRRAEIMITEETAAQNLRVAEAELNKARLDLRTVEVRSEIEAEKLELAVEEAEATLKQLGQEVELQKTANAAELRSLELESEKNRLHVERHNRDLERLKTQTPVGGLVVMESMYRGGGQFEQAQVGDQVNPGTFFMRVVDLSKMVVSGIVNQVDSQQVRLGQKVEVRLDAYPDLVLPGRVSSISAMASSTGGGSRWRASRDQYVKGIGVEISIQAEDPRVIPDLSASADIVIDEQESRLLVPTTAVHEKDGKSVVFVRQDEKFVEREVEIGPRNETHAVVSAGLTAGEEVALREVPNA